MPIVAEMTVAIHSVVRTFSATMFVSLEKKTAQHSVHNVYYTFVEKYKVCYYQ